MPFSSLIARGTGRAEGRALIANLIVDFFRNLGQQRIDGVVITANAKKAGAMAKAKAEAAKKFNAAVDAPVKAAKGAVSADRLKKVDPKEGDVGWFSRKKPGPVPAAQGYVDQDRTLALDVSQFNRGTFQPCVGWVVVRTGELMGRDFRLVDGKNTVGTAADCDVVLTDPYLSSKQCVIRYENGTFTLVDLDSTNGTFLNESRVSKEDLIDNDTIRVGRTELKFKALE